MPIVTFPNANYRLDHDSALQSQNQASNFSTIYTRTIVRKVAGSGYAGTDGFWVRADSNVGALGYTSGTSWSFQNGSSTGEWWYFERTFQVGHDANGYAQYQTTAQAYFGVGTNAVGLSPVADTGVRNLTRIPKKPSKPGTPQFTDQLPTSLKVSWAASSDNAGSAITGYLLRYWPNAEGTGSYTDHSFENNTSRVVTNLIPGNWYRFAVYARNGSADNNGYSVPSDVGVVRMLSGARIRSAGVYKTAIPYQRTSGVYKLALPFVRSGGVYKNTQ